MQLWAFTRHSKGVITKNADALREASIQLMLSDEFSGVISHNISAADRVERRFRLWADMVDEVLAATHQGVRNFDRGLRAKLYKEDRSCHLCGQAISDIDDAHVDHDIPYGLGGQTTTANASLAHRFCNLSKGAGMTTPTNIIFDQSDSV